MTYTITDAELHLYKHGAEPFKVDKNGTRYFHGSEVCPRCKGTNFIEVYKFVESGRCFECNGLGRKEYDLKVMTPEYAEKLEQRRAKAEQKNAEEKRISKVMNDAEVGMKRICGCNEKKCNSCEKCIHRGYCSILSEVSIALQDKREICPLTEEETKIADFDFNATVWETVEVVTLEGEACRCSRWFENSFGSLTRCITKPDGTKVYTSARTDKGLAKYGIRTYDYEKEGSLN